MHYFPKCLPLAKICDGHQCCMLVVDVRVPGPLSAAEFVNEARKRAPDISVFVYSGVENVDEIARELKAIGYCQKPCDPEHLIQEFRRLCRKDRAIAS